MQEESQIQRTERKIGPALSQRIGRRGKSYRNVIGNVDNHKFNCVNRVAQDGPIHLGLQANDKQKYDVRSILDL